jgi:hypothetical protein
MLSFLATNAQDNEYGYVYLDKDSLYINFYIDNIDNVEALLINKFNSKGEVVVVSAPTLRKGLLDKNYYYLGKSSDYLINGGTNNAHYCFLVSMIHKGSILKLHGDPGLPEMSGLYLPEWLIKEKGLLVLDLVEYEE